MSSALDPHPTTMLIRKLGSIGILSDAERKAIGGLSVRVHNLEARQDIVRDGDVTTHCCLVISGWACRYKLLSEGRRQILSFHVPGDIPDFQSLHIRTMDHGLAAVTNATVAFISHDSLREMAARHPGIASLFWRDALIDAGIVRAWTTGLGRRTAYGRVAHLFCELYLKLQAVGLAGDHRCPLPLRQVDLADALGLTSVHVNRVLKELRGRTLITLRNRMLVIEAWDELLRASEFDPTYLQLTKPVPAQGRDEEREGTGFVPRGQEPASSLGNTF